MRLKYRGLNCRVTVVGGSFKNIDQVQPLQVFSPPNQGSWSLPKPNGSAAYEPKLAHFVGLDEFYNPTWLWILLDLFFPF